MKRYSWQILLAVSLLALSAALYWLAFCVWHDAHYVFVSLLLSLAFLPVEVLLVTLIIHRLLTIREKRAMLKKLNMVIGAFFSEVGTGLLRRLRAMDVEPGTAADGLSRLKDWTDGQFAEESKRLSAHPFVMDARRGDPAAMRVFLVERRAFLLGLLENANLLEHERFTELLWAVFHLCEELENRRDFAALPDTDYAHLAGDARRVYGLLLVEWIAYLRHLKSEYPYLFSLAVRTNPLDDAATAEVR